MEIPEINMISNFEAGVNCLQNPSLISRFFSIPGIDQVPQAYSFWKWGALIFAIFATFSSIIRKIKLFFIRLHTVKPSLIQNREIFDFTDDDDFSSLSSDDEDEDEGDEEESSSTTSSGVEEDFRIKGSSYYFKSHSRNGQLRRRSCGGAWSEFSSGINVVKLWDKLSLNLDFDEDMINNESVVPLWGYGGDEKASDFSPPAWDIPAASVSNQAVVLTAEENGKGDGFVFAGYDTRIRRRTPALYADWDSPAAEITAIAGDGVGKIYVRDDVSGVVTIGDVRNVRIPLENVRESDGDTWWDADAVIVEEEF